MIFPRCPAKASVTYRDRLVADDLFGASQAFALDAMHHAEQCRISAIPGAHLCEWGDVRAEHRRRDRMDVLKFAPGRDATLVVRTKPRAHHSRRCAHRRGGQNQDEPCAHQEDPLALA